MKKFMLILGVITSIALQSCENDAVAVTSISSQINAYPKEELSTDETASLIWMREEEKLARDVYLTLYSKWDINIFSNIAESEQTHTNAVLTLIKKYNLVDPVGTNGVGIFKDTTFQKLYTQLVAQGNISLLEAFKVGATIEDLDIYDLNNLSKQVDNQDIKFVYGNLNKGSRNHLRSFYSQITSNSGTYKPQYISQSEFDAIINSDKETGSWQ